MPIYEYVCESCAHRFEVKQKITDDPIKSCARCGQSVNKVISAPAIMFKGSGWYVTDYSDKLKAPSEAANGNGQGEKKPAQPAATPAQAPATPSTSSTTGTAGGSGAAPASTPPTPSAS